MSKVMSKATSKTKTNTELFVAKLTILFEQVEAQFLEATIERYRRSAAMYHQSWLERMSKPKPENNRAEHDAMRLPQYTTTTGGSYAPYWDFIVRDIAKGLFKIDYERAESDARAEVATAKLGFVTKNSRKLATATKLRNDIPKLSGALRYEGGIVTGLLTVDYGAGCAFKLHMSIKVNYRNGSHYYQFPAIFQSVVIGGVAPRVRISEKWMSENFKMVGHKAGRSRPGLKIDLGPNAPREGYNEL